MKTHSKNGCKTPRIIWFKLKGLLLKICFAQIIWSKLDGHLFDKWFLVKLCDLLLSSIRFSWHFWSQINQNSMEKVVNFKTSDIQHNWPLQANNKIWSNVQRQKLTITYWVNQLRSLSTLILNFQFCFCSDDGKKDMASKSMGVCYQNYRRGVPNDVKNDK